MPQGPAREGVTTRTFQFPVALVKRAIRVGKVFHTAVSQLAREGLELRVVDLEKKEREEEEQRLSITAQKKAARAFTLRKLGDPLSQPLTRPISTPFNERIPFAPRPVESTDEAKYVDFAKAILDAGEDRAEMKRRAVIAVEAIKREHPLTHPPEADILGMLEQHIAKLRASGITPVRTYDAFVGAVLDPNRVKSLGDIGDEE
jgi:hypothetical protein